jgi:hypothetical protein
MNGGEERRYGFALRSVAQKSVSDSGNRNAHALDCILVNTVPRVTNIADPWKTPQLRRITRPTPGPQKSQLHRQIKNRRRINFSGAPPSLN